MDRIVLFVFLCSVTLICWTKKIPCGDPLVCNFYTTISLLECENVADLPTLNREVAYKTKVILITGKELREWPHSLKRDTYPGLKRLRLENTQINCDFIPTDLWYEVLGDCLVNSKMVSMGTGVTADLSSSRPNATLYGNISVGSPRPVPKIKMLTPEQSIGLSTPGPNVTMPEKVTTQTAGPTNQTNQRSIRGPQEGNNWIIFSYGGWGLSTILAVFLIILIVLFRYKWQHSRRFPNTKGRLRPPRPLPPVENIGTLHSLETGSSESIELFSQQPLWPRRRSLEKEL